MTTNKKNYYDVLGLSRNASIDEVKKAFKTLARKYHPDANKDNPSAEAKFQEISEAYSILGDADKKQAYDQFGSASEQPGFGQGGGFGGFGGFSGFGQGGGFGGFGQGGEDLDEVIKKFFGGGQSSRTRQGEDIIKRIVITLADVIFGKEISLELEKEIICTHCHGSKAESPSDIKICDMCHGKGKIVRPIQTPFGQFASESICPKCKGLGKIIENKCHLCKGKGFLSTKEIKTIKIPVGIEHGQKLVLKGYGKVGADGSTIGDLYLTVEVSPHNIFERDENDLIIDLPVSILDILMGAIVKVPTFYGDVKIEIPANTKPSTILKVKKKGVPYNNGRSYGDLYIRLKVESLDNSYISKAELNILKDLQTKTSPKINDNFCNQVNKSLKNN